QFVGDERFPKDQLVDLPWALDGNSSREVRAKPKSDQVHLGGARYFLEFLNCCLDVIAPACEVSLPSVAIGVASSKIVESQHMKTCSNEASGQLPHAAIGKNLLVAHWMAEQGRLHLAGTCRSRFVVAKK